MTHGLTLEEAGRPIHVSHDVLLRAIHNGTLRAERVPTTCPTGQVVARFQTTVAALAGYVNTRRSGPDLKWTTMADIPRFRTLREVAEATGLPLWWLTTRCQQGKIPRIRPGRSFLMSDDDVRAAELVARAEEAARTGGDALTAERQHAQRTRRGRRKSEPAAA